MLDRLATLGMQLAEQAFERAHAESQATPRPAGPDSRITYTRLANDVRQSIEMHARIEAGLLPAAPRRRAASPRSTPAPRPAHATPHEAPRHPPAALPTAPEPPPPAETDRRRPGIVRYINEGLQNTRGPAAAENLRPEIEARITAELANDPEGTRPGTIIIATICKDIGLPLYNAKLGTDLTLSPKLQAALARSEADLRNRYRSTGPPRKNPPPTNRERQGEGQWHGNTANHRSTLQPGTNPSIAKKPMAGVHGPE